VVTGCDDGLRLVIPAHEEGAQDEEDVAIPGGAGTELHDVLGEGVESTVDTAENKACEVRLTTATPLRFGFGFGF
jgi:hypothetical protein